MISSSIGAIHCQSLHVAAFVRRCERASDFLPASFQAVRVLFHLFTLAAAAARAAGQRLGTAGPRGRLVFAMPSIA